MYDWRARNARICTASFQRKQSRYNRIMIEGMRNLLVFALVLGGLIFFHEFGHYLVALRLGIKVKEFGIGFPPRLITLGRWRGTDFTLNAIPFGGFVRPLGEDDPSIEGGLSAATPWRRAAVLVAGSVTNALLALLVLTVGFATGWPDRVVIMEVAADSPAEGVGLRAGDIVLSANGQAIHMTPQLANITHSSLGQPVLLEIERQGLTQKVSVIPRTEWPEPQGPIGVALSYEITRYSLPRAAARAAQETAYQTREIVLLPVRLITRQVQPDEVRLVSPVGLKAINDQAVDVAVQLGQLFPVLQLLAFFSLALAVTNLLPLPALDGGRILFVLLEMVRGKRVAPEKEGLVHFVGMAMLLGLMVMLVIQDFVDPVVLTQ
jgi:regulator of sigma E protease